MATERWSILTLNYNNKERQVKVSDEGRIYTFNKHINDWYELAQHDSNGYKQVHINHGDKIKTYTVHRLVACAFKNLPIEQLSGKRQLGKGNIDVCHKDGNRQNNKVSNLYIASHKDNCNAINSLYNYQKSNRKFKCGYSNLRNDAGAHFDDWHSVADYVNRDVMTARANIRHALKHNSKAYGYKWEIDRDESWYSGKNTKYYKRADGTRPNLQKTN